MWEITDGAPDPARVPHRTDVAAYYAEVHGLELDLREVVRWGRRTLVERTWDPNGWQDPVEYAIDIETE